MPLSYSDKQDLLRDARRDTAERYRLQMGCARLGVLDAVENDEPLREFAIKMLKKLSQKIPADPVAALTSFIEGHDSGVRARDNGGRGFGGGSASDASETNSFVDRYIRGEA